MAQARVATRIRTTTMSVSRQLLLRLRPEKNKVFDNFLPANNKVVVDHLRNLYNNDASKDNQIYLWGANASGKSHLLQAICSEITQLAKCSIYLPLQRMELEAAEILEDLESVDLICIDDMDLITQPQLKLERPLFNLINRLRGGNGCLVMAGRSNPKYMTLQLPDLQSRLLWGGVYQMNAISDQDKPAALTLHARLNGSEIPDTTMSYLLSHYPRDMDYLTKVVNHISHVGFQCKRRLTIPFVKEVLKEENL